MVENVITSRLEIQGYENIKQIKDEITKLRQQMKELATGTEEYKETADQLVRTEYDLKQAMASQKKDNSSLVGSYNELVNQMGALKKVWRETTDEAVRADYGAQINALNTQLKQLDATTGNYQRNVGDYKNQLKQAKAELAQLTQGTAEYNAKLAECAEIAHNYKEQQELIKNTSKDLGDQLANVAQIGTGLVAGFSAIKAAMGLFGKESKDVQKAMLKVQQAMALVQGLKGMEGLWKKSEQLSRALGLVKATTLENAEATDINTISTERNAAAEQEAALMSEADAAAKLTETVQTTLAEKAQRKLNAALKANPLGFVLGLVVGLAAAISRLIKLIPTAEKNEKKRKETLTESANAMRKNIEIMEAQMGVEWKYSEEGRKAYKEYYEAAINGSEAASEERHQILVEFYNWERELREKDEQEVIESEEKMIEAINERVEKMKEGIEKWESLVSRVAQTEKEKIHDEIVQDIKDWNEFMDMLPNNVGSKFNFNISNETKANFQKEISQLLTLFDEGLVNPMIEGTDEYYTQITGKSIKNLKTSFDRFKDALAKEMFDFYFTTQKNEIANDEKITNARIDEWTREYKRLAQLGELTTEDLINQQTDIHNERMGFYDDQITYLQNFLDFVAKVYGKDTDLYKEYTKDVFNLQMEYNHKMYDEETKYNDTVSKLRRDDYNDQLKEIQSFEDLMTKTNKQVYDRAVVDYGDSIELRKMLLDENYEYQKDSLKQQIEVLKEALDDEELMYEERAKFKEELDKAEMSLTDLKVEYEIEAQRLVNEKIEEGIRKRQELLQQTKEWIQSSLDTMNTYSEAQHMLIDARLAEEEKLLSKRVKAGVLSQEQAKKESEAAKARAEKEFDSTKGIMRAQTMISTLLSAMEAYSSLAGIPYVGPVLGAAAAATALQFGYAQIKQIDATNPYSDNSLSGSEPNSNNTSVTPAIDDYSPNRVTNITGAMETENLANAITRQPIWVSVSDIDRAQNRVQVKEAETTF